MPSGCDKIATVQIQRYKRGVKVHIYILYIEHSWANSHIMVALEKEHNPAVKQNIMKTETKEGWPIHKMET